MCSEYILCVSFCVVANDRWYRRRELLLSGLSLSGESPASALSTRTPSPRPSPYSAGGAFNFRAVLRIPSLARARRDGERVYWTLLVHGAYAYEHRFFATDLPHCGNARKRELLLKVRLRMRDRRAAGCPDAQAELMRGDGCQGCR